MTSIDPDVVKTMLLASQRHHLLPVSNRNERSARTTGGQMVVLICGALALAGCDQISSLLSGAVKGEASENSNAVEASPDADSPASDEALDLPKERDGMVLVPAGKFWMGCTKETDKFCRPGLEGPRYEVWLDTYYIDKTEVTVDAYRTCVTAGLCSKPGDSSSSEFCNWDKKNRGEHPINCVPFDAAVQYCDAVGKSLPMEAQWAKAAQGMDGRKYPWGDDPVAKCPLAHLSSEDGGAGCGTHSTAEVASYSEDKSPYGALDMLGNVSEWVLDEYIDSGLDPSRNRDPEPLKSERTGADRIVVLRGASLARRSERRVRLTLRVGASASSPTSADGFRCVSIGTDPPKPKFDVKNPSK